MLQLTDAEMNPGEKIACPVEIRFTGCYGANDPILMGYHVMDLLTDFITGKTIPNTGSEENRQAVERFLVEQKGFERLDVEVDMKIEIFIDGQHYRSQIDLVVSFEATTR